MKLDEEATEIRKQYLLKYTTSFTTSEDALKSSIKAVIECRESFLCKSSSIASKDEGAWYTQVWQNSQFVAQIPSYILFYCLVGHTCSYNSK